MDVSLRFLIVLTHIFIFHMYPYQNLIPRSLIHKALFRKIKSKKNNLIFCLFFARLYFLYIIGRDSTMSSSSHVWILAILTGKNNDCNFNDYNFCGVVSFN